MKSIMVISMDSGILLFSELFLKDNADQDSLGIIQLASSLFALYELSRSAYPLKWLRKGDMLLIFRATTCYSTLSERTTGNRDGLLVIVAFDAGFEKEEAANVADAITNLLYRQKFAPTCCLTTAMKKNLRFALWALYKRILDDLYRKFVANECLLMRIIPTDALVIAFRSVPSPAVDFKEQKTFPVIPRIPEKDCIKTGIEESRGTEQALSMPSCSDRSVADKLLWDPSKGDQSPVREARMTSPKRFFSNLRQYFKKPSERDQLITSDILNCSPPTGKGHSAVPVAPQNENVSTNGMNKREYMVFQKSVDPTYEHEDDGDGDMDIDNTALMAIYDKLIATSENSINELIQKDSKCVGRNVKRLERDVLRAESVVTIDTTGCHLYFPTDLSSQDMTVPMTATPANIPAGGGGGGGEGRDIERDSDDKIFKVVTIAQSGLHLLICTCTNTNSSASAEILHTDTQSTSTALPLRVPEIPSSSSSIPSATWLHFSSFCSLFIRR